jgi:hypothetical protein
MKPIVEAAGFRFTPSLPQADMGAPGYLAKYPENRMDSRGSARSRNSCRSGANRH